LGGAGSSFASLLSSCVSILMSSNSYWPGTALDQARNCTVGSTWSSCLQFGKRSFRADPRRAMARSRECGRSRCRSSPSARSHDRVPRGLAARDTVAASSDHRLDELGAGGLVVDQHFGRLYGHSGFCGCPSGKAARCGMRRVRKLTGCRAGTRGDDSELQPLDVKIANRVLFAKCQAPRSRSTARISLLRRRATSWA